jgi:Ca2+/H+ antiporter
MKPETKYALLILALSIIWKMGLLIAGFAHSTIGKYPLLPVFGFLLIGMFRGMEERRKLDFNEEFSFPALFKSGMSIAALFTVMYCLFLYFYLKELDVEFRTQFISGRIEEATAKNMSDSDIGNYSTQLKSFPFVSVWILFTFIGLMTLSTFYSGVITRMMRKKYFPVSEARKK